MGTYNLPRDVKGEGRILFVFSTKALIYSIIVEDEQYEKIENKIRKFEQNKGKYDFNIWGLFAVSIKKKIRAPRKFYCAEFVKYILQRSGVQVELPEIIKPEHFKNLPNKKEEYRGLLRKYNQKRLPSPIKDIIEIYSRKEGII